MGISSQGDAATNKFMRWGQTKTTSSYELIEWSDRRHYSWIETNWMLRREQIKFSSSTQLFFDFIMGAEPAGWVLPLTWPRETRKDPLLQANFHEGATNV